MDDRGVSRREAAARYAPAVVPDRAAPVCGRTEGTERTGGDTLTTVLVPQSASKRGPLRQLKEFTACASDLGRNPREVGAILWRLSKNVRVRFGLGSYHPDRVYALPTRYSTVFLRDNFGDVTN